METKNVTINKFFEIPVVLTTEKIITVPDFTQMVHAITNNVNKEKEIYEIYNKQFAASANSMLEQLKIYLETLLSPLNPQSENSVNYLDIFCHTTCLCCCYNGVGIKMFSYDCVKTSDNRTGKGLYIKIGTGNGHYDFVGYLELRMSFYDNKICLPKYNPSMNSILSAFAKNWPHIKKKLEETIENRFKVYQEQYEKKTLFSYNQLSDIANFEI